MKKLLGGVCLLLLSCSACFAEPEESSGWYWQDKCYDKTGVVGPNVIKAPIDATEVTGRHVIVWQGKTGFPFIEEYVRLVEQGEGRQLHPERWTGVSDRCGQVTYYWREAATRLDKDAIYSEAIRSMYKQLHGKTPQERMIEADTTPKTHQLP